MALASRWMSGVFPERVTLTIAKTRLSGWTFILNLEGSGHLGNFQGNEPAFLSEILYRSDSYPPASSPLLAPIRRFPYNSITYAIDNQTSGTCLWYGLGETIASSRSISLGLSFLGELTTGLTGQASISSAGYCLRTARASSSEPESQAS